MRTKKNANSEQGTETATTEEKKLSPKEETIQYLESALGKLINAQMKVLLLDENNTIDRKLMKGAVENVRSVIELAKKIEPSTTPEIQ